MELTLSTRRAQLSVAAKAVSSTDLKAVRSTDYYTDGLILTCVSMVRHLNDARCLLEKPR